MVDYEEMAWGAMNLTTYGDAHLRRNQLLEAQVYATLAVVKELQQTRAAKISKEEITKDD